MEPVLVVSVPDAELLDAVGPLPATRTVVWDLAGPPPEPRIDLVVAPYMGDWTGRLPAVAAVRPRLVQGQMLGYDGVADRLPPGIPYANAIGVHEASTAELAVALVLASLRRVDDFVREAAAGGVPVPVRGTSLADRRVLLIGVGGVGSAIARRLEPFEVDLTRVGRTARQGSGEQGDGQGPVHGIDELPALLPAAEVVILAVPLHASTTGLVGQRFVAAMADGALLVNVSRGAVADTDAVLAAVAAGRIRFAADVTDPEPLPAGHPLLTLPGSLLTPHVGGNSTAMRPRIAALVRRQAAALAAGAAPAHVVLPG